jgi:large subunit ribosomal protein L4
MATLEVVDWTHNKVGEIDVADEVFAAQIRPHLHWEMVRWQRACRRSGNHSTKTRSETQGTGRKPFRQKGTGRARQGDFRSPLQRGGAVVHGPRPRSYAFTLPRKVRKGALRSALSMLNRDRRLLVVKDFSAFDGKSRTAVARLKGLGVDRGLLIDAKNETLRRGVHNLGGHKYVAVEGINVLDMLHFGTLVISETALRTVEERLKNKEA